MPERSKVIARFVGRPGSAGCSKDGAPSLLDQRHRIAREARRRAASPIAPQIAAQVGLPEFAVAAGDGPPAAQP